MKTTNMTNRNGKAVANQFIITGDGVKIFKSYSSVIVKIEGGKTYVDANKWNFSRTTAKYRNIFLGEDTKTTERKIKEGVYILANLN